MGPGIFRADFIPRPAPPGLAGQSIDLPDLGIYALSGDVLTGAVSPQTPSIIQTSLAGIRLEPFSKVFYDRVYVVFPETENYGLIAGEVQRTIKVWNAFRSNTVLSELQGDGTDQTVIQGLSAGQSLSPLEEVDATFLIPENAEGFLNGSYTFVFENGTDDAGTFTYNFSGQKLEVWPDVGRSLEPNWAYGVDERFEMMTEIITSDNNNEQRISKRQYPRHFVSGTFLITPELQPTFRLMMIKSDRMFLLPYWMRPHYITTNTPAGSSGFTIDSPIENLNEDDYVVYESPAGLIPRQVLSQTGTDLQLSTPTSQDIPANARIWKGFYGRLKPETSYQRVTGTISEAVLEFDVQNEVGKLLTEPFTADAETYKSLPVMTRKAEWSEPLDAREFYQSDKLELGPNNRAYFYKWEESQRTEQIGILNFSREDTAQLMNFFLSRSGRQQAFWRPSMVPDMRLFQEVPQASAQSLRVTPGRLSEVYRENSSLYRDIMIQFTDGERRYYEVDSVTDGVEYATVVLTSTLGRELRFANVDRICWLYYVRFAVDDFTITHETTKVSNVSLAVTTVKNRIGE